MKLIKPATNLFSTVMLAGLASLVSPQLIQAQVPAIHSFTPGSGPVGTPVTLIGTNFSPVASSNIVWFGAVATSVAAATNNQLTVLVPTNANQSPITVGVNGLVCAAPAPFVVTYEGAGIFSNSSLATPISLPSSDTPVSVKIVDLDGDGKSDLVVANNTGNMISIYRNISTNGALTTGSFAPRINFAVGATPRRVTVGDIDGDGKRDLIVANHGGATVSVFRNISTPGAFTVNSLAAKVDFATGANPLQLELVDLNGDGKLDLVTANAGANTLSVLRNTATTGSINASSFASKVDFLVSTQPGGVAVGDIDGDGKLDVALSNDSAASISILRNVTPVGSTVISFAAKVDFATPARPFGSLSITDLDGDGKPDIAVAAYSGGTVSVFRNISTAGVFTTSSLAARFDLATGGATHEVLVVDINGDSKSDLVAVSENANTMAVFRNVSTNGTLVAGSFAPRLDFPTALNPGGVAVGDLDGDGRPDAIAAASFGNVLSMFRNLNVPPAPIAPAITSQPTNRTLLFGSNVSLTVAATGSQPLIFQWQLNGTNLLNATNTSFSLSNALPTQSGNYTVIITNSAGSVTSAPALVKIRYLFPQESGQRLTNEQHSFFNSANISFESYFTNGLVFYTLDGSTPDFASEPYTGPFVLNASAFLRAITYSADFLQSGESDPVNITITPTYALSATTAGGGSVVINSTAPFLSNSVVTVTANPSSGWTFLQWLGDASDTNPTTPVTMTRNKSVQAVFGTTLNATVAGSGSVAVAPASGLYPYGTVAHLTATPEPGNYFGIWGNAASGNTNPLNFAVVTPNPTVSSLFSVLSAGQFSLTVSASGAGQVAVSPRANRYSAGAMVSITATPDAGQIFTGWSGDASGMQNPLSVTMNQSKAIVANFTKTSRLAIKFAPSTVGLEGFQLTLTGAMGESYLLQRSTNLWDWFTLTAFTNSYGTSQFSDLPSTNSNEQFYRAVQP